jgi:hypothetical protein
VLKVRRTTAFKTKVVILCLAKINTNTTMKVNYVVHRREKVGIGTKDPPTIKHEICSDPNRQFPTYEKKIDSQIGANEGLSLSFHWHLKDENRASHMTWSGSMGYSHPGCAHP